MSESSANCSRVSVSPLALSSIPIETRALVTSSLETPSEALFDRELDNVFLLWLKEVLMISNKYPESLTLTLGSVYLVSLTTADP